MDRDSDMSCSYRVVRTDAEDVTIRNPTIRTAG